MAQRVEDHELSTYRGWMSERLTFTITLDDLANGAARQSTLASNGTYFRRAAMVHVKIVSGAVAPTATETYKIYLLRGDGTNNTDGAGASDAAITILNAPELGTITVTNDEATAFYGEFDTASHGPLGETWGIAVLNDSGQAVASTGHVVAYRYHG